MNLTKHPTRTTIEASRMCSWKMVIEIDLIILHCCYPVVVQVNMDIFTLMVIFTHQTGSI